MEVYYDELHDYADGEHSAWLPQHTDPASTAEVDDTPPTRSRLPRAANQLIDFSNMNDSEVLEEIVTIEEKVELEDLEFLHHWINLNTHVQR